MLDQTEDKNANSLDPEELDPAELEFGPEMQIEPTETQKFAEKFRQQFDW